MIKFLSKKQFSNYIENKYEDKICDMFITYDNGKYIGCDNTTGNKWVEEFEHLQDCIDWLKGKFEIEEGEYVYYE